MSQYRYKAFISYSHQDEDWGRWLQRALESYRVPRRLVGGEGKFGPISRRIAPVFRDREDLSSAASVSSSVKAELENSETLIVICSPAAARSNWVNEEVRYFHELGRGDRILAMIVDGDPTAEDPEQQCFPRALLTEPDGTPCEPLAADARKWADGRSLARLKLVAGILGIRLDDLRRRDMQRRHRLWMLSMGGAMAVAIVTTVLAIFAITARNQAEHRREQAESLVGYMVDDLQSELQEVGRLDILKGMGGEVSKYLQTLDPGEVTDTSLQQQALVWRHLGDASMDQGRLDDAMSEFEASRSVLAELHRRDPGDPDRVFELAQAEFWVGWVHVQKGDLDSATEAFDAYLSYANDLAGLDPDNPRWVMEQSYAHGNKAAIMMQRQGVDPREALEEINLSVELNRRALELDPGNDQFISEYGEALAWQADTLWNLCDLGAALKSRQENVRIAEQVLEKSPGNATLKARYAYSLTGLASVANDIGLADYAMERFVQAWEILRELFRNDPSNLNIHWDSLFREYLVATLEARQGDPVGASNQLSLIHDRMEDVLQSENYENAARKKQWVEFLLRSAEIAWLANQDDLARRRWHEAATLIEAWVSEQGGPTSWRNLVIQARFLDWQQENVRGSARGAWMAGEGSRLVPQGGGLSCHDRSLLVLEALMDGNEKMAREQVDFLLGKGFFEPGFISVCSQYGLCQGRD